MQVYVTDFKMDTDSAILLLVVFLVALNAVSTLGVWTATRVPKSQLPLYHDVLALIVHEQGEWYAEAILSRELANILRHNASFCCDGDGLAEKQTVARGERWDARMYHYSDFTNRPTRSVHDSSR